MKMKYVVGLVALVVIGSGIWWLKNKSSKGKKDEEPKTAVKVPSNSIKDQINNEDAFEIETNRTEMAKEEMKETIENRHADAAKAMQEALEDIVSEPEIADDSENKETLDQIDDSLDKLLDE